MAGPGMIITGATGFVGRHLVEALQSDHTIWALSRGSPRLRGLSLPARARWIPVDIAVRDDLRGAFRRVEQAGGASTVVHLAGYYDFTGEPDPEYERTNVVGTRNVLEAARDLGIRDFIFSSSLAACAFPPEGTRLTEDSSPAGDTPYARSKRAGEEMIREFDGGFRSWVIRFAALFSDWCEYEPVYRFMEKWLSPGIGNRIVAGRGRSAVPYLHIRDATAFVCRLLELRDHLDPAGVLIASPDGAISHRELHEAATGAHFGRRNRPLLLPRPLCRAGLWGRDRFARITGAEFFERPWMARMIDLRLDIDGSRSRAKLGWSPRARLGILRRMPFLVQNRKAYPGDWSRRNHAALRTRRRMENLRIVRMLEERREGISGSLVGYLLDPARAGRFPHLHSMGSERQRADALLLVDSLIEAVGTGEKSLFQSCCHDLARRRRSEGVTVQELLAALNALGDLAVLPLIGSSTNAAWSLALYDHITMTVQFGVDELLEVFNEGE